MSDLHSRILDGDGSHESPFVIHTANYNLSRQIQTEIIDNIYGQNKWNLQGRYYYTSPRGTPGNSDLCQHHITIEGRDQSVWFDLHLVTRLANDPAVRASLKNLTDAILRGSEVPRSSKPATHGKSGCLGMFLLLVIAVLFTRGGAAEMNDQDHSERLQARAETGDAEAEYDLGLCYLDGKGVAKNEMEAVNCFRKAANQGYAHAQIDLGICYAKGKGVVKDDVEALKWFRKGRRTGYPPRSRSHGKLLCRWPGRTEGFGGGR